MANPKLVEKTVEGETQLQQLVAHLCTLSCWFEITPEPDDMYTVSVKEDVAHLAFAKLKQSEADSSALALLHAYTRSVCPAYRNGLNETTELYQKVHREINSTTKCIVKDCENHTHEGRFVGDLCSPCHAFITTGEGGQSQAYRNAELQAASLKIEHQNLLDALKGLVMYPLGTFQVVAAKDAIAQVEERLSERFSACN
jgi:hypothetical protein